MKHQTVGLQFDFQKSKRAKPWKTALPIAGVPLLAAVLLLALKPARESLKCLCNLVFAASEAVNAYAYDYFEVSDAASPVLALGLLVTAAAGVLLLAYLRGSKIVPLLAALAIFDNFIPNTYHGRYIIFTVLSDFHNTSLDRLKLVA